MFASPIFSCVIRVSDSTAGFESGIHYGLWAGPEFAKMIQDHNAPIKKFPHRVQKCHQREFDFPLDPEKLQLACRKNRAFLRVRRRRASYVESVSGLTFGYF